MNGTVSPDGEPRLGMKVYGPTGTEVHVEAVVDTGFTGYLTLSPADITSLALIFHGRAQAMLADGTVVTLRKYEARVDWHGQRRDVLVLAADGGPLLGTALVHGSRLTIEMIDGGDVMIQPLP